MKRFLQLTEEAQMDIYTKELIRGLTQIKLLMTGILGSISLDDLGESSRDVKRLLNNPSVKETLERLKEYCSKVEYYLNIVIGRNFASLFYDKADTLIKNIYRDFEELKRVKKLKKDETVLFLIDTSLSRIAVLLNRVIEEYNEAVVAFNITANRQMNYYFEIN